MILKNYVKRIDNFFILKILLFEKGLKAWFQGVCFLFTVYIFQLKNSLKTFYCIYNSHNLVKFKLFFVLLKECVFLLDNCLRLSIIEQNFHQLILARSLQISAIGNGFFEHKKTRRSELPLVSISWIYLFISNCPWAEAIRFLIPRLQRIGRLLDQHYRRHRLQ